MINLLRIKVQYDPGGMIAYDGWFGRHEMQVYDRV